MKPNQYLSITAEECDAILGARFELAAKYGWMGRCTDAYDGLTTARLLSNSPREYGDHVVEYMLAHWDAYNDMCAFMAEKRLTGGSRSALELHEEWQATRAA